MSIGNPATYHFICTLTVMLGVSLCMRLLICCSYLWTDSSGSIFILLSLPRVLAFPPTSQNVRRNVAMSCSQSFRTSSETSSYHSCTSFFSSHWKMQSFVAISLWLALAVELNLPSQLSTSSFPSPLKFRYFTRGIDRAIMEKGAGQILEGGCGGLLLLAGTSRGKKFFSTQMLQHCFIFFGLSQLSSSSDGIQNLVWPSICFFWLDLWSPLVPSTLHFIQIENKLSNTFLTLLR